MKITDSQKAFLLGILGVAIAALAILYVAKPNYEAMNATKSENMALEQRLADLQVKEAKRDEYLAETEEYQQKFDDILNAFPADLNQEISIMFVNGIKEDNDFDIASLGLGEKEQFYTLGIGGGDTALNADGTAAATDTATTGTATTEAGATDASAEASTEATTEAGAVTEAEANADGGVVDTSGYVCYRAAFPITYSGSYKAIKDVVSYVDTYSDRMVVDSINIVYDAENDLYSGDLNLMCYAVESEDRPERKIELEDVEIGVSNVFQGSGESGASGNDNSLNKYDENDGAAITSSYDFYAMINPSGSDVSAKVVGQNGAGKEASVISNSDNTVSTLSFEFYEKDGKNYCKYTLDNSTSYEAEVTSAEDIKLLLQSSARKDENDKVGIRVTINNTSSLPVYVKVDGDDVESARVTIASKTGSVKVYK